MLYKKLEGVTYDEAMDYILKHPRYRFPTFQEIEKMDLSSSKNRYYIIFINR